ncbi:molybdopterin-dependent oxidoreductase [Maledivibacter halophilus]|uniref:Oxidoreductase molybdopterin binding domain-containing protein n=1 Tax=Maledivibacter halophilus TaxID=36842 RepID=A0A1T5JDE6_9FIRM|nr:molybdopterin-dependent oxidoreductase [Maledivibacter halophilus]SKC49268.1 Oxidoreductase molybdopterin binding domain-containing protein [Maledivibacter halophilus]
MNKKITIIVVILVAIVGITSYLNLKSVEVKKELQEDAKFIIKENGKEVATLDMKEIRTLGEREFKANLKKDGKDPIPYTYTGVPLKNIFEKYNISLEDKSAVIVSAVDGYTVAVDLNKVLEEDNVYLAYMREGQSIGNRENGGKGPYQMIISKDQFSQHWCKFAVEADVK